MQSEKIKKIKVPYLLGFIFIPILVCAICFTVSILWFPVGNMAAILFMVPIVLTIIWYSFGGTFFYNRNKKKMGAELKTTGFVSNQTFYGRGCTVWTDLNAGKIALLFFWNPTAYYVLAAKRMEKIWVEDGKCGAGFMEGSSAVSFLFRVDGVKVKIYTFTSNKRFRMDSKEILTGISKADAMAQALEAAKQASV